MKDTMEKDLAEIEAAEKDAVANFEAMVAAKTKQIEALTKEVEAKLTKVGVELVNSKEDLDDTTQSLVEDKNFLADMDKTCEAKKKDWTERSAMRAQELLAIAETIKILNDDDALELFKKTLPSPSLLQTQNTFREERHRALKILMQARSAGPKDYRLELLTT